MNKFALNTFKGASIVIGLFLTCSYTHVSGAEVRSPTLREIYMDDIVPEVVISVTESTLKNYDKYLIKLHQDVVNSPHWTDYRISLVISANLRDGDTIHLSRLGVDNQWLNQSWNDNSFYDEVKGGLELYIDFGGFSYASADFTATLYYETSERCADSFFRCQGPGCERSEGILEADAQTGAKQESVKFRCVSKTVQCNNRNNCGKGCNDKYDFNCCDDCKREGWSFVAVWMFVAILFMVLFAISVIIICCCCCWRRKRMQV